MTDPLALGQEGL